jgi:hypothetical protein
MPVTHFSKVSSSTTACGLAIRDRWITGDKLSTTCALCRRAIEAEERRLDAAVGLRTIKRLPYRKESLP